MSGAPEARPEGVRPLDFSVGIRRGTAPRSGAGAVAGAQVMKYRMRPGTGSHGGSIPPRPASRTYGACEAPARGRTEQNRTEHAPGRGVLTEQTRRSHSDVPPAVPGPGAAVPVSSPGPARPASPPVPGP